MVFTKENLLTWLLFWSDPSSSLKKWDERLDVSEWWWVALEKSERDRILYFFGLVMLGNSLRGLTLSQWSELSGGLPRDLWKLILEFNAHVEAADAAEVKNMDDLLSTDILALGRKQLYKKLGEIYPELAAKYRESLLNEGVADFHPPVVDYINLTPTQYVEIARAMLAELPSKKRRGIK